MVMVGVHVSIAGSLDLAVDRAGEKGCDVFQIFSRNPRGWGYRPIPEAVRLAFREKIRRSGLIPVNHMPYLPNLASPKKEIYEKSIATLSAELERCEQLGIPYLVTHLGHHLGDGIAGGRKRVIAAIDSALGQTTGGNVMLLLENTAGEKNSIGSSFEHIRSIVEKVTDEGRIGICFDTCHAFAAGYELRTESGIVETFHQFDELIGLEKIKVFHLNDSRADRGSGLDRHEHIGLGSIGESGFLLFLHQPQVRSIPLICETPVDQRRDDMGNIRAVRDFAV